MSLYTKSLLCLGCTGTSMGGPAREGVGPPGIHLGNFYLDTQDVGGCTNYIAVLAYPIGYYGLDYLVAIVLAL